MQNLFRWLGRESQEGDWLTPVGQFTWKMVVKMVCVWIIFRIVCKKACSCLIRSATTSGSQTRPSSSSWTRKTCLSRKFEHLRSQYVSPTTKVFVCALVKTPFMLRHVRNCRHYCYCPYYCIINCTVYILAVYLCLLRTTSNLFIVISNIIAMKVGYEIKVDKSEVSM